MKNEKLSWPAYEPRLNVLQPKPCIAAICPGWKPGQDKRLGLLSRFRYPGCKTGTNAYYGPGQLARSPLVNTDCSYCPTQRFYMAVGVLGRPVGALQMRASCTIAKTTLSCTPSSP
jgi:hypothetical protein